MAISKFVWHGSAKNSLATGRLANPPLSLLTSHRRHGASFRSENGARDGTEQKALGVNFTKTGFDTGKLLINF